jgi:hypothetical protein
MGYDLHGEHSYFGVNCGCWSNLLNNALKYGWRPEGTTRNHAIDDILLNQDSSWNGNYFLNAYQIISSQDAS